ncbi:MAG TPA: MFS transporter [Anaerolineales bacterium]|nr:MFS transporter [Anaerolineales bacterium]
MSFLRLDRLRKIAADYPRQFWLLFWGVLLNSIGGSMVWPFLTIYARRELQVPLTTVTLLLTLNSVAGLAATSMAGPAVDRFGRRAAMVLSLGLTGLAMAALSRADTLPAWQLIMVALGGFGPVYRVGADAMVADLVPGDRRPGAYALMRMISNLGVAIGPAVGGFLVFVSYDLAFFGAAGASVAFAVLILIFAHETLPERGTLISASRTTGYGPVLRDRPFLLFCGVLSLAGMGYSMLMVLLPVYAKESFGVPESQYGFILATNAAMVVLFQYSVTKLTMRYPTLRVLAIGSLFYAVGVGSVALGSTFPAFLGSMIILTVGELIMAPTSTTLTAALAPPDMRGRYMGIYALTWGVSFGIGPVLGGILSDQVAPVAIWYSGLVTGLVAVLGFILLSRSARMARATQVLPVGQA